MRERFAWLGVAGLALLMHGCASAHEGTAAIHIKTSMLQHPPEGMQGELEWSGNIDLGHGVVEPALIEVTSKGNGFMKVCGQSFRVYDGHDDGQVFEPPLAHITFVDFDGDGYRDLVLFVGRRSTERDGTGAIQPYLRVFKYRADLGRFEAATPEEDEG